MERAEKRLEEIFADPDELMEMKPKEVLDMIIYAWETKCKGFTIYREGSRGGILINKKKEEQIIERNTSRNYFSER